jgi:hypothetical protein
MWEGGLAAFVRALEEACMERDASHVRANTTELEFST